MIIKVVFFHNKSLFNIFGNLIQWSVKKNNQVVKLNAITNAKQDKKGKYILEKNKINFVCNHTGVAYQKNNEWYLLHMVQSGLRDEEYCYIAKTRNYFLFEKEFNVDEKKFKKTIQNIKNNRKDYQYGLSHAFASFDFRNWFGVYLGSLVNTFFDKQRKKSKGQYCQGLVSEILLNSLSTKEKNIFKKKILKYYNSFYKRDLLKISDNYIIQETTPADMLCCVKNY